MYFIMSVLAVFAGVFFAVQGPINTALGKRTSVFQAAAVSFLGGAVISGIIALILRRGDLGQIKNAPFWQLIGGCYGAVNVAVTIAAIPVVGAALALTAIMFGQILAAAVIDGFGLLGSPKVNISSLRIAGIIFVAAGILMIYFGSQEKKEGEKSTSAKKGRGKAIIIMFLAFLAGILGAMQSPTNAALASVIGSWEGTFVSFIAGFVVLLPITLAANKGRLKPMTKVGIKWWMLTGGLCGVGGIFLNIFTVPSLGTALQVACGMLGQLTAGILIDSLGLIQTQKVKINFLRVLGVLTIACGVVLVTAGNLI